MGIFKLSRYQALDPKSWKTSDNSNIVILGSESLLLKPNGDEGKGIRRLRKIRKTK